MAEEFEIGTTALSMANLVDLTEPVTAPKSAYMPYAGYADLGDGSVMGVGAPIAIWHFPAITREARDQLKAFCPGASAEVFIRTKLNNDSYEDYTATMVWPEEETRMEGGHRIDLTIVFRNLAVLGGS